MIKSYSLIFLMFAVSVSAQNDEPIATDRPDQTETPQLVPAKMFQVESGVALEKHSDTRTVMPSVLYKYGVNDNFELRLITEFSFNDELSGLTPVLIGFKSKIADQKGIWPQTSIIAHIAVSDLASNKFKTEFLAPEFRFTMQHTLSEILSISYNLGAEWNGFSPRPTYIYTLATAFTITQKLGSFVELYGFAPHKLKSDHRFDGGLTYLISNNVMVDLSGGVGITSNSPDYFLAGGFSFRI